MGATSSYSGTVDFFLPAFGSCVGDAVTLVISILVPRLEWLSEVSEQSKKAFERFAQCTQV